MKSFHSSQAVKDKYLNRLMEHHRMDKIIQGEGWNGDGGCAVGCTLEKYNHKAYEDELGLPEWLARLEDSIFEGLPEEKAPKFAVDFLTSIPVGVDVEKVKWKFCSFILKENIERVLGLKNISDELKKQVVDSIRGVLTLTEEASVSGNWDESAAESAARSAWSAAESASSAAWSARSAAWSARSASSAAESASSAASSAAWSAARSAESAAYERYAGELLRLLKKSHAK